MACTKPLWRCAAALTDVLLSLLLLIPAEAPGCSGDRPAAEVAFAGSFPEELAAEVLVDLRADLVLSGREVCPRSELVEAKTATRTPVRLSTADGRFVEVLVEGGEAPLLRRVDLLRTPADSRALTLAVATAELLRVRWAVRPPPEEPPPPPSTAPEQPAAEVGAPPPIAQENTAFSLAGRFSAEHYGGGQTHLGPDLELSFAPWPALRLALELGYRSGLTVSVAHGNVLSSLWSAGLGARYAFLEGDLSLEAELSLRAARLQVSGQAIAPTTDRRAEAWPLFARAGARAAVHPARWLALEARLGAGLPLRTFTATEGSAALTAMAGPELYASLGACFGF